MNRLDAFVGHSFEESDKEIVQKFLDFFDRVKELPIGFTWDHAKLAESKELSKKVKEKMEGKNLFIGICTAKEDVIAPSKLKEGIIWKNTRKVNIANIDLKTSDWILQEIGFAVGRGMRIILLLEEGVREPGSLQGDLEYIPFNRSDLEQPHNIFLEMLKSCMPPIVKETVPTEGLASEEPKNIEEMVKDEEAKLEPRKGATEDLDTALFNATVEGDRDKVEEIFQQLLEKAETEYDKILLHARSLYWGQFFLKEDNLDLLIEMQRANPKHESVNYYLGKIYERFEEYGKAADCSIQAAENAQDDRDKLFNYVGAAYLLAKNGEHLRADQLLEKSIALKDNVEDAEWILLNEMARIALLNKEDDNYLAFLEGYLDEKPNDHGKRFSLAYKYSELGNKGSAIYHYKILTEQNPDDAVWNNMGAAQSDMKLLTKSIQAYRESEKLGSTLAMGNMAFRFINAGFIEEADKLCALAVKKPDFDAQVASAITKIKEVRTEEDHKLNEIIENIKPRRNFYVRYAHACTKRPLPEISGTWRGPNCDLNVIFKGNEFDATGSYEETRGGGGLALGNALLGRIPPPTPPAKVMISIKYSGKSIGYGIRYKLEFQGKGDTILTGFPKENKEGLMVISGDLDEIEVYEKGVGGNDKYYSLKKGY
jgi:tetratricopeptide (TPR) repeat protein